MEIQSVNCASCGAPIKIPSDVDHLNCIHCNSALVVRRGEGYIALKIAEHVSEAVQNVGEQTQAVIQDGTRVTKEELQRLQLTQQISGHEVQLSNLQTELRTLTRQKKSRQIKRQIKELRNQETHLRLNIRNLRYSLAALEKQPASQKPSEDLARSKKSSTEKGCLTGCFLTIGSIIAGFFTALVVVLKGLFTTRPGLGCLGAIAITGVGTAILWVLAIPLDVAASLLLSKDVSPFMFIASITGLLIGILFFYFVQNPEAKLWISMKENLKKLFRSRKAIIIAIVLVVFLCVGYLVVGFSAILSPAYEATATAKAIVQQTGTADAITSITEIAKLSATPTLTRTSTATSTPTQTATATGTSTLDPSITPPTSTSTATQTSTFTPSPTLTHQITLVEIYDNFEDMTAFQFDEYKTNIMGKKLIDIVKIGNVSDDGKLLLSGPWSPLLVNISDFCVIVNNVPRETALSFSGGEVIVLEATIYGLVDDYGYYFNCENTLILRYITHE